MYLYTAFKVALVANALAAAWSKQAAENCDEVVMRTCRKIAKTREEDLGRPLSSGLHKSLPLFFPLVLVRVLAFFVLDLKQSPFLSYVGWWLATEDRSIGFYNTKRPRSMRGSADPLFFSTRALSDPSRSIVFYNTKRPRSKPIRGTDRPIHWFFPHGPFPIQADPA